MAAAERREMTVSLIHLSDPHFGVEADLQKVGAVEALMPDLQPDLIVVSGDLTERARHGEMQAARQWIHELERTSRAYVMPGDHDVEWWRIAPFTPPGSCYETYTRYFGPALAPTIELTEAIVAGALTSHQMSWTALLTRPKTAPKLGILRRDEMQRVQGVFKQAKPHQAKVLVMHHHVLADDELSSPPGVANAPRAWKWIVESGADLVLCGHDHAARAEEVDGVVVSRSGTLSSRVRSDRSPTFHRIVIEEDSIQIELYEWVRDKGRFRRTDVHAFARKRQKIDARQLATRPV
jgi:3',5'-cyclic AMP phosphodiesterase CpdA